LSRPVASSSRTLTDWELWACAAWVEREHGDRAPVFVAERIGALALAGDADGVEAWRGVARRMSAVLISEKQFDGA
jgi:hypothetical protein